MKIVNKVFTTSLIFTILIVFYLSCESSESKKLAVETSELNNQTIDILDLSGNNITALPNEICNLKNLEKLNLYGNRSLTSLPKQIGNLVNLQELALVRTGIEYDDYNFDEMFSDQTRVIFHKMSDHPIESSGTTKKEIERDANTDISTLNQIVIKSIENLIDKNPKLNITIDDYYELEKNH